MSSIRLPPTCTDAVLVLLALDPGEFRQRVDDIRLGVGPGLLVEGHDDAAGRDGGGQSRARSSTAFRSAVGRSTGETPLEVDRGRSPRGRRDGHVGGLSPGGRGDRAGATFMAVTPSTRKRQQILLLTRSSRPVESRMKIAWRVVVIASGALMPTLPKRIVRSFLIIRSDRHSSKLSPFMISRPTEVTLDDRAMSMHRSLPAWPNSAYRSRKSLRYLPRRGGDHDELIGILGKIFPDSIEIPPRAYDHARSQ